MVAAHARPANWSSWHSLSTVNARRSIPEGTRVFRGPGRIRACAANALGSWSGPQLDRIRPDAISVLQRLAEWFEDYNTIHPHSGLRMRSPREFIAAQHQRAARECCVPGSHRCSILLSHNLSLLIRAPR